MLEEDHERFLRKNRMMAQGFDREEIQKKIHKKLGDNVDPGRKMSCFNCKKKNKCQEFKEKSTGGSSGTVSIGAETTYLCDRYEPIPIHKKEKSLSGKQIKNILKAAKKGRL
jgi:hypothetical protein